MQSEPLRIDDDTLSPHQSKPLAGKRGLKQRIVDEVVKFLIAAFYLWVMFGTFALHESVVSDKDHINFHFYGLALVNALILGKVMLVAEDLHFADWFKDRPLFYPILCKAVAFSILFLVFYFAEVRQFTRASHYRRRQSERRALCRDHPLYRIDPVLRL